MRALPAVEETRGFKEIVRFVWSEMKPKGNIFTPFNMITAPIMLIGAVIILMRFTMGLGATTNLSQEFPWGLWIAFDVMIGIAFAGGAYTLTFVYYILGAEKYHPIIRATILNGFLAYVFYSSALLLDLGRPWNALNYIIGNKYGVSSVLFMVAWHFFLYTVALFLEFSPIAAEWLGLKRVRKVLGGLTLGAVIFGIMLSTGHQAGIGGIFLLAKHNIHPLWYSDYIHVLFVVSSIFAGLSMVIFEGTISHRVFHHQMDHEHRATHDDIVIGLGKVCAVVLFVYFFIKLVEFLHGKQWGLVATPMGYWYLTEIIGFVLVPCALFLHGARHFSVATIRAAAILTMVGILINRFNICIIAYKWWIPLSERYLPSWMEVMVTLSIICAEMWVFRWVVNRMPVLRKSPAWVHEEKGQEKATLIRKEVPQWKASAM
ncbi:MAG: polysulfide reductase NrfD [Desulfobacterota bacterium]|nr:polysulfide reductase NrfD [Thermodesulfobacteriota bacterium]